MHRLADGISSRLGNLQNLDVLPTSTLLNLPAGANPSEAGSRLGVRFVVHGAIQMSKGQWRLSLEMFDSYAQRSCFSRKCDVRWIACPSWKAILRSRSRPH